MGPITQLRALLYILLGTLIGLAVFYKYSDLNVDFSCNDKEASNDLFLQERLNVAESIWIKSVEARHLSLNSSNLKDSKSQINYIMFLDYFYASFDCPFHLERIGRVGDGGKWICGFQHLIKRPPSSQSMNSNSNNENQLTTATATSSCIVYSFGVLNEITFEEEIAKRTTQDNNVVIPCRIHMYDNTIDQNKYANVNAFLIKYNSTVKFHKFGIGASNSSNILTLSSLMKQNGHDWIDILKIDIEGSEFDVLKQIVQEFGVGKLPFGQLQLEVHFELFKASSKDKFLEELIVWFEMLESAGLRAFHREGNYLPYIIIHQSPFDFFEYSFINVKNKRNPLLHAS